VPSGRTPRDARARSASSRGNRGGPGPGRPPPDGGVRRPAGTPTDPYLEWCWLPLVGPSTVALVRHVAELTSTTGEARIPLADLGRLLGLGAVDVPSRNNKLVRTLARAELFSLAFTGLGVPGEQVTFGIHERLALVPARLLERLPDIARQRHETAVAAANEALAAAVFLPSGRRSRPSGRPLNAPGPPLGPRPPIRCRRSSSGPCTRFRRSPASTPTRRPRRRRPNSFCDPDATAHLSHDEPPPRSRRTRSRPLARSRD
jgi:hypothetical protein